MPQDWMNDPKLNGLDKSKLALLQNLADQGGQKSPTELLPFLMAAANQGKNQGVKFNTQTRTVSSGGSQNGQNHQSDENDTMTVLFSFHSDYDKINIKEHQETDYEHTLTKFLRMSKRQCLKSHCRCQYVDRPFCCYNFGK